MDAGYPTRRGVLTTSAALLVGSLAGCRFVGDGDGTPKPPSYDHLKRRDIYVAEGLDLPVPDQLSTVESPADAELLVLPADTDVDAEKAVDWLADDRVVALVGAEAQPTWLDWTRSDAFVERLGRQGFAEAEPAPDLLVALPGEDIVSTSRATWNREVGAPEVFGHIDDALAPE